MAPPRLVGIAAVAVAAAAIAVVVVVGVLLSRRRRRAAGDPAVPGVRPRRQPSDTDLLLAQAVDAFNVEHRSIELGRWLVGRLVREVAQRPRWLCYNGDELAARIDFRGIVARVPRTNPITVKAAASALRKLVKRVARDACPASGDMATDDLVAALLRAEASAFGDPNGAFYGFYPPRAGMQLAGYQLPA